MARVRDVADHRAARGSGRQQLEPADLDTSLGGLDLASIAKL
jgi:hypothetical protein